MEKTLDLDAGQYVGFATRVVRLHWLGGAAKTCAAVGGLLVVIGGFPLLSSKRDPNYDLAVATLVIGIGMLMMCLLVAVLHARRQKRELEGGRLSAAGVFWNPETKEKTEGQFHLHVDSGTKMPGDPTAFTHRCHNVQHTTVQSCQMASPLLEMAFTVGGGMKQGKFGGSIFSSRRFTDLDTIIFIRGSIIRLNARKADPVWLCSEVGAQLQEGALSAINVQLTVQLEVGAAASYPQSSAVVTGVALGGLVGGAIGEAVDKKRDQERNRHLHSYLADVASLRDRLRQVSETFGWNLDGL
jgi:hypothetical protein